MLSSVEKRLVRKIGRTDALLFFVVCAVTLVLSNRPLFGSLSMIILFLLPASALVGWRGAVSARLILAGDANFKRVALEGFAWGAGISFFIVALIAYFWRWLWPTFASPAGFLTFIFMGC